MVITKCDCCGREIDSLHENFVSIMPRIGDHTKSERIIDLVEKFQDICPECLQRIIKISKMY